MFGSSKAPPVGIRPPLCSASRAYTDDVAFDQGRGLSLSHLVAGAQHGVLPQQKC